MKKKIKTIKMTTPRDRKPSLLNNDQKIRRIVDLSEEGLKRFTYFFPFVAGALLVYRFQIINFQLFTLNLAVVALAYHCATTLSLRHTQPFPNYKFTFYYGLALILLLLQYHLTADANIAVVTGALLGLSLVRGLLAVTTPSAIVIGALTLIIEITIIPIIGVYSQEQKVTVDVIKVGILGFVPGCVMAGALLIENLSVFEKYGWQRAVIKTNRKGIEVRRPKGISQWYSLLLVIGPIVAISEVYFQVANSAAFGYIITMILAAQLSQAFFEETIDSKELVLKTFRLAALTAALGFPIGLFASI